MLQSLYINQWVIFSEDLGPVKLSAMFIFAKDSDSDSFGEILVVIHRMVPYSLTDSLADSLTDNW